jgi:four helix bundle protein
MVVKRVEELIAFQQAVAFKREVYAIVHQHARAERDYKYRDQLFAAASGVEANIAEGWRRFSDAEIIRFLRYALSSLEEGKVRLLDGVDRGHFNRARCDRALSHAARSGGAMTRLIQSLGGDDNEGRSKST